MTTKEEKARLKSIRMLLVEIVQEVDEMLGIEKKERIEREVINAQTPIPDSKGPMKIGDLNIGDTGITIEAEILEIVGSSGTRKHDATPWKLTTLTLSDKTGPIKLKLWNEQTEHVGSLQPHDVIRVEAWKVEKGYQGGVFELVYGQFGTINKVNIERHII